MFHVLYAGERDREHHVYAVSRPVLPVSTESVASPVEIPGRSYGLTERSGFYKDMEIPVDFNYLAENENKCGMIYRDALIWLRQPGVLQFSDDLPVFYKVRYVSVSENERANRVIGRFTANFICQPGAYYAYGAKLRAVENNCTLVNTYSLAEPVFELSGHGPCQLTVNGKTMTAEVDGVLTIDTDRRIAYKAAGASANTDVTGDYEDLLFMPGDNVISVSEGFSLRVQPNWRVL